MSPYDDLSDRNVEFNKSHVIGDSITYHASLVSVEQNRRPDAVCHTRWTRQISPISLRDSNGHITKHAWFGLIINRIDLLVCEYFTPSMRARVGSSAKPKKNLILHGDVSFEPSDRRSVFGGGRLEQCEPFDNVDA